MFIAWRGRIGEGRDMFRTRSCRSDAAFRVESIRSLKDAGSVFRCGRVGSGMVQHA
jgi:hypothetical protein